MTSFEGKTYWIVGASEGLGAALAHKLSQAGAHLVLSARFEDRLQTLADSLPGPVSIAPVDVTDGAALTQVAQDIPVLDGVIQMAGVYWPFGAHDWDADQAETMAEINFTGAVRLVGAVLLRFHAQGHGHLVLTGSLSGYRGLPDSAPYTASKAGVMALAECLYADLHKTAIKVQLINPGFIRTRLTDKNSFAMPALMEPEDAAEKCMAHLRSNKFARAFPTGFSLVFRLAQFLPDWAYYRLFA